MLETNYPEEFAKLNHPRILNGSPAKSLAVQKFIYTGFKSAPVSDDVARQCRYLGLVTPVIVITIVGQLIWWFFNMNLDSF
ncbi:MAG: hypothetical protein ACR2P6_09095 [Gammaproteobacteria bacterium]